MAPFTWRGHGPRALEADRVRLIVRKVEVAAACRASTEPEHHGTSLLHEGRALDWPAPQSVRLDAGLELMPPPAQAARERVADDCREYLDADATQGRHHQSAHCLPVRVRAGKDARRLGIVTAADGEPTVVNDGRAHVHNHDARVGR